MSAKQPQTPKGGSDSGVAGASSESREPRPRPVGVPKGLPIKIVKHSF